MTAQEQPTAAEIERLAARLATHLSVKDSSPGFHLSDEDFRLIISALCATSLNARLATPPVQAPAAGVGDRDTATAFYRLARFKTEYSEMEKTIDTIAQALADREAAARADERQECATLVGSWPTINYGSFDERLKVQQACVDMAAAIRARSAP